MENVDGRVDAMRVFHLSAHVAGFVFFSSRFFRHHQGARFENVCVVRRRARRGAKERTNDRDDDDDGKDGDDGARVARATRGGNS